jgi:Zn-finger nucleic acid-binding protein
LRHALRSRRASRSGKTCPTTPYGAQMAETATLICPKCQGEMRTYERNGVLARPLRGSRGVFLDRGELERLLTPSPVHEPTTTITIAVHDRDEHDRRARRAPRQAARPREHPARGPALRGVACSRRHPRYRSPASDPPAFGDERAPSGDSDAMSRAASSTQPPAEVPRLCQVTRVPSDQALPASSTALHARRRIELCTASRSAFSRGSSNMW